MSPSGDGTQGSHVAAWLPRRSARELGRRSLNWARGIRLHADVLDYRGG